MGNSGFSLNQGAITPTSAPGALFTIRYPINTTATQDSTEVIPIGARVLLTSVEIDAPYDPGTTIEVGQAGSLALLEATTDNTPQVVEAYQVPQDTDWGVAALPVRATIGGAPAAGSGHVLVQYSMTVP